MAMQTRSPTSRRAAAILIGIVGHVTNVLPAAAGLTSVPEHGAVQEADFALHVELAGAVAVIESTQVLASSASAPQQAIYTFDLPAEAAVTALSVRLSDGRTATGTVVDASAALAPVPDPDAIEGAPDVALLRMVARDHPDAAPASRLATYELRVYPIAPGRTVTVSTTWVTPVRVDDGRMSVRIPARGRGEQLVRERVRLTLQTPPGARGFSAVHGGGAPLAATRAGYRFQAPPAGDLVIEVTPIAAAASTRAAWATAPLGKDFGAVALSVTAPLPPSQRGGLPYERVVLVIDASRSMGVEGLDAGAVLADALLAGTPAGAGVEAVLFDRSARRVFGGLRDNAPEARRQLDRQLRAAALGNGSDLGGALAEAGRALIEAGLPHLPVEGVARGEAASTLVVILSDGMVPLSLTATGAAGLLGERVLADADVAVILLSPDEAPLPDTAAGVLGELVARTGGRALAVRHGEARARAATLAAELAAPPPLLDLEAVAGAGTALHLPLPATLEAGRGLVAVGFYRGAPPRALELRARHAGAKLAVAATRDDRSLRRATPLALVGADLEQLVPPADRIDDERRHIMDYDEATLEQARRALNVAARRAGVVTPTSALVALDERDRFARERRGLLDRWGPAMFTRVPPPPERAGRPAFEPFEERAPPATAAAPWRRTGELDRTIIRKLIERHVVPGARGCYQRLLRQRASLAGSLVVVIEIARGEVQHAAVERSTLPGAVGAALDRCVVEAAYAMQVPRVALGDDPESIGVARYPLRFRVVDRQGEVSAQGEPLEAEEVTLDPDDPLGGLRR